MRVPLRLARDDDNDALFFRLKVEKQIRNPKNEIRNTCGFHVKNITRHAELVSASVFIV